MAKRDFNKWISGFCSSIANFGYYIDFDKVHRNVESIKVELNILNSLIGSKNIEYEFDGHINRHFGYAISPYKIEDMFLSIHKDFPAIRDLKEEFVSFNKRNAGKPQKAAAEIEELITEYANCGDEIFERFSRLLKKYKQPIINSFVLLERTCGNGDEVISRLSNGPMESMNRLIKDLRRLAHGFRNFEHLRNRFLFATRNDPILNGKPYEKDTSERSLRFSGEVHKEKQRELLEEYQILKEKYPDMTKDEVMSLKHWISEGNSPFINPDMICDEYGVITDFITASRILDEAFKDEN